MRKSAVEGKERDTPTHLINNCESTHDGHVTKDRIVMADGTRTSVSYLAGTWQSEAPGGKQELVEAVCTHKDSQAIATCTYNSCREPAIRAGRQG